MAPEVNNSSKKKPTFFQSLLLWLIVVSLSLLAYGFGLKLGRDYKAKREKISIAP